MICKMCATAADMQSRAKEIGFDTGLGEELMWPSRELHRDYCSGPKHCDCQHKDVT